MNRGVTEVRAREDRAILLGFLVPALVGATLTLAGILAIWGIREIFG